MSVLLCKYITNQGWVGIKNIDAKNKPSYRIRKSYRGGVERLMVWDDVSKYTEGINEYGICIISIPRGNRDEYRDIKKIKSQSKRYYSPAGYVVRKALLKDNCADAVQSLIESGIDGSTVVFNSFFCYLLKMEINASGEKHYSVKQLSESEHLVISNIECPDETDHQKCASVRIAGIENSLYKVSDFDSLLDAMSCQPNDGTKIHAYPIIPASDKVSFRTVAQLILCPESKTLHFRPIWGEINYDMESLNVQNNRTFFEIVSTRKLLTFRQVSGN